MAHLYINVNGKQVSMHSYSAGQDFKQCKRLYKLKKIEGWQEKDKRAALEFGKCLESAIQAHHQQQVSTSGWFAQLWQKVREIPDLVYTDKEGNWEEMLQMGTDMARLYELRLPELPIKYPRFQMSYRKSAFERPHHLSSINVVGYIDVLSRPEESLVIDLKTSGAAMPSEETLMLDPQLRVYAWLTGVQDVAFLWFQKAKPSKLKKGDEVSSLIDGKQYVVAANRGDHCLVVGAEQYTRFEKESKGLRANKLTAVLHNYLPVVFAEHDLTKQRLQFGKTRISHEDMIEAGESIADEIEDIIYSNENDWWPKNPGIRFPNNQCLFCPMLGICTGDNKLRDQKLMQAGAQKKDWIAELEAA